MKAILILGLCAAGALAATEIPSQRFDPGSYGAKGDGASLDTAAINKAIDAAHAAGGGTVYFTAGTYLSGSIHLLSNVAIYLAPGATILATDNPAAYDQPEPNQWDKLQDYGHSHFRNSLMWGEGLENVSILGPGRIWGKGLARSQREPQPGERRVGNKAIVLKQCRNVTLKDFSILMGGWFGILATGVDNLTISNLKIDTNRDGMDIISCRNVRISDCTVNTPYDDGICLKSDYSLGFARATENVTITNCLVSGYDNGTVLDGTYQRKQVYNNAGSNAGPTGRIKFGTESNGGFKNITISNVVFDYCRGLALETVDGGLLEDVTISNVAMRDIFNSPIFLRLGSRLRAPEGTPAGQLRRVNINNLIVYNADPRYSSILSGIPGHDIEDVRLSNIRIYYAGGGTKEQAALVPQELETAYPEPRMFGEMPAYGFFIRHVKGIELNDVEVGYMKEDLRPAFYLENVRNIEFNHVKSQHAAGVPTIVLKSVVDFLAQRSSGIPDSRLPSVDRREF
ncbi:MAG TPA: glycoside hydrolase family 28 protein [Bryobacteraceae bacterium]|nr:glycoside hydrolase family 28 protein [Bryobacteraceae bacterium]